MGEKRYSYKIFDGQPEGMRLQKPKMDLKNAG
jgi:hypothetical protein